MPRSTTRTPSDRKRQIQVFAWNALQRQLRKHLQACKKSKSRLHEQSHIAYVLGVDSSCIHRWADKCGCDHQTEPSFSMGFALFLYLNDPSNSPHIKRPLNQSYIDITPLPKNHPASYPTRCYVIKPTKKK